MNRRAADFIDGNYNLRSIASLHSVSRSEWNKACKIQRDAVQIRRSANGLIAHIVKPFTLDVHSLVTNIYSALGQKILHVSQRGSEPKIYHHHDANDLRR